jgi:hypothetical protein
MSTDLYPGQNGRLPFPRGRRDSCTTAPPALPPPTPNPGARAHQQAADSARRASQQAADSARRAHQQASQQAQRDARRVQQRRAVQRNLGVPRRPAGNDFSRPAHGPPPSAPVHRSSLIGRVLKALFAVAFTLVFLAIAIAIIAAVAAEIL